MIGYLTIFHVVVCILIILLVLLQFGKGAEVGLFASSSENMFSTSQRKNVLARATTVLAVLFIVNSLILARLQGQSSVLNSSDLSSSTTTDKDLPPQAASLPAAEGPSSDTATTPENLPVLSPTMETRPESKAEAAVSQ
jgi:preprotein translocase subunit SecG